MVIWDNEIDYIVKIKDNISDKLWNSTTCSKQFCGKIANVNSGQLYFELNGPRKILVIVPLDYIEWMAPSKILWEKKYGK